MAAERVVKLSLEDGVKVCIVNRPKVEFNDVCIPTSDPVPRVLNPVTGSWTTCPCLTVCLCPEFYGVGLPYAPGCQIVTLSVASISEAEKGADVNCEDLPPMTFNGRVDLPEALRARPYEVEISYKPYWALRFFNILEGSVTSFILARVAPDDSGEFRVELPNFNKDRETVSHRRDAGLQFVAREPGTGNIVALLAPVNVQGIGFATLPIKPKYPAEVVFKPAPESPPNQIGQPAQKEAR